MRFIYIRAFQIRWAMVLVFVVTIAIMLVGLRSVLAINRENLATSWAIANRVIVVDPGHGGIDPGAVGQGVTEKRIVLEVAKRLKTLLNHAGAKVIMTRDSDTDLGSPGPNGLSGRKREDLANRVELANSNKADLYLSIHVNAFPSSRWRGAQTFYQRNQAEGKKLAEAIQGELVRVLGNTDRVAKAEDFYTTRNTNMASAIVEIGFISNPAEAELLTDAAYQRKLALAIYSGLVKYYAEQLPKQEPEKSSN